MKKKKKKANERNELIGLQANTQTIKQRNKHEKQLLYKKNKAKKAEKQTLEET